EETDIEDEYVHKDEYMHEGVDEEMKDAEDCRILDIITQARMIGLANYLERESEVFLVRDPVTPSWSSL
ncbi:hypothetical protein Tco_0614145, partial [Tanacetum coccineum]